MPISVNGANGITFADGSIQNTGAAGFGFKNRIINGAMTIAQRGTSFSAPNPAYTTDRWNYICWNGNTTVAQSTTAPAGFSHSLSQTIATGGSPSSSQWQGVGQVIEAFNVTDLGWGTANAQTVTLSFWVRSSITGIYNVTLSNINGVQNHSSTSSYHYITTYTINSANTWEYKTITIAGPNSGSWNTYGTGNGISVWFDLGSGTNYNSSSPNTWESSTTFRTSSATSQVSNTTGSTWYLTGVQLEKGSTATAFDWRPYGNELQLSQRYYEPFGNGWPVRGESTNYSCVLFGSFKVEKRASPTITVLTTNMRMYEWGVADRDAATVSISSTSMVSGGGHVKLTGWSTIGTGVIYGMAYNTSGPTGGQPFGAAAEF